jgi:hypothetical protein
MSYDEPVRAEELEIGDVLRFSIHDHRWVCAKASETRVEFVLIGCETDSVNPYANNEDCGHGYRPTWGANKTYVWPMASVIKGAS